MGEPGGTTARFSLPTTSDADLARDLAVGLPVRALAGDLPVLGSGLHFARGADGARGDAMLSRGRLVPIEVPELPGELLVGSLVDRGRRPGPVVDADLDSRDGSAPGRSLDPVAPVLDRDLGRNRLEQGAADEAAGEDPAAAGPRLLARNSRRGIRARVWVIVASVALCGPPPLVT